MPEVNQECEVTQETIMAIFKNADADGNNILDEAEFLSLMKALDKTLSTADIQGMMKAADVDKNGTVCIPEFISWVFSTGGCTGVKHVKSVVHAALHVGHPEPLNNDEITMYWNQAQKACGRKPDGFADLKQMCFFMKRISQNDPDIEREFGEMWGAHEFTFTKKAGAAQARKDRDLDSDDELLDQEGFVGVMDILDH